jgi:hypothetical protein
MDVFGVAGALPLQGADILQKAWLLAAEQLQKNAIDEVHLARVHVLVMRTALAVQRSDARRILDLA